MKKAGNVSKLLVLCIIFLGTSACAQESEINSAEACGNLKIFKFNDHDASGTWNNLSEQRLAGFRFNVAGPISFSIVTNAWGEAYQFCIPYGNYTITEQVPSGWTPTTPNPVRINVDKEDLIDISFGNKQMPVPTTSTTTTTTSTTTTTTTTTTSTTTTTTTSSTTSTTLCGNLKIFKYNDYNSNGIWEEGEPTLAGVRFNISGPQILEKVSDSNGEAFAFCILQGEYVVTELIGPGWKNTTANPQRINLFTEDIQEARFGNVQIPATTTSTSTTTTTTLSGCGEDIIISAAGVEAAGIPPIMQLWVDARMKAQWNVSSILKNYTYDMELCAGHNIDVVYANDCSTNGTADRNLYVYYIIAAGQKVYSNETSVKYDRGIGNGAFDGVDVVTGRTLMDLSGALRFKVNGGLPVSSTTTTSGSTTTTTQACSMLWWFDNDHFTCNQSEFCNAYLYYGLRTFAGLEECLEALNASCSLAGDYVPCGQITLQEVIGLINQWAAGDAQLGEVIDLITAYTASN
jgi:hypothetical protein